MFKGCATALITPFREDGEIDEEGLRELVRMQERAGVDALVPCGTTGESATLTHKEHLKVIGIVREEAKRAQVIAGAGSGVPPAMRVPIAAKMRASGACRPSRSSSVPADFGMIGWISSPTMRSTSAVTQSTVSMRAKSVLRSAHGSCAVK